MIELHGYQVFQRIEIPGGQRADTLRNQCSPHQGKGVENHAGLEPGDETAGHDGDQHQAGQRQRTLAPTSPDRFRQGFVFLFRAQIENRPQDKTEDHHGAHQVCSQAVLTDVRVTDQAALDHVPAQ